MRNHGIVGYPSFRQSYMNGNIKILISKDENVGYPIFQTNPYQPGLESIDKKFLDLCSDHSSHGLFPGLPGHGKNPHGKIPGLPLGITDPYLVDSSHRVAPCPPDPGMSASTAGSGLGDEAVRLMAEGGSGPGESLSPKKVLIWVWINTY